ncbi:T9SS type A sorting domain-containing protein [Ochrovirga pacifica]|uniref:T9SS type A sorting domain-containing protein n=1 Tax=Ochrovirga pacifica TaxID=1042376 RepID=UPI00025583A7|nr:T9SS type A sorting domain-containing protein [Ochrovirga pacifica]
MIKKLLKSTIFVFSLFVGTTLHAQTFTFDTDLQDWSKSWGANSEVTHAAGEGVSGSGALKLIRLGSNSNFGIKNNGAGTVLTGINATTTKYIRIIYKNETNGVEIRLGGTNGNGANIKTNTNGNVSFSIGANSDEYITSYLDMSDYTLWTGDLSNFYLMVRQNEPDTAGDAFYLDEIEFLSSMPATTYSEFVLNPSFDGPSGITHLSGAKTFATRGITSTQAHDGSQSLKFNFTADADDTYWTFSNYEKIYDTPYTAGSTIQVKMWVKTNRSAPISLSSRVKLTNGGTETSTRPITSVSTTNTTMGWEEVTFDLTCPDAFDGVTFWFSINHDAGGSTENLLNGDVVFVDQITATITDATLSTESKKIQGAFINVKQGTITVSGANLEAVYSITGQQVSNTGLSNGIYIVKITKGSKQEAVKVIM